MSDPDGYLASVRSEISQGDIFEGITVFRPGLDGVPPSPPTEVVRGLLVTHDCEFDKPRTRYCVIAQVRSLVSVDGGTQANVRQNRVLSAFFLPALRDAMPDSFADFRDISSVLKDELIRLDANALRVVSLDDAAREALQEQLVRFFVREPPAAD